MRCRRCDSTNLIALDKRLTTDNLVLRCRECGFLFSPPAKEIREAAAHNRPALPTTHRAETRRPETHRPETHRPAGRS